MNTIAFIDTEIDARNGRVLDIGGTRDNDNIFHNASKNSFTAFVKGVRFVCGHNILAHDIKYIGDSLREAGIRSADVIDTLYLSPLLFPSKPYHALVKDDKLQHDELSNPLNDAIKAKDLFYDEVSVFRETDERLQQIYYLLLNNDNRFCGFFRYIEFDTADADVASLIRQRFQDQLCMSADLGQLIKDHPVELAYCLSLISAGNRSSVTPRWVLKNFPAVERLIFLLRNKPCITGCSYCNKALDAHLGLKKFFGFSSYREYAGEALQLKAVKAAIHNKSLLAVFPTGGGKSITFQVPALMAGEAARALTVIISPLQSLMKDQVDNLEKNGITDAVTINGLLDPIERAKSFERVGDGSASLLYLSPESLRSKTIENLLLGRKIARFVIDEAHCFSSWGQDFRVDYLYIGDFIKSLQETKNLNGPIPVSCFTATAKPRVIEDIRLYFSQKLDLDLQLFTSTASRTNLHYKVIAKDDDEEKYQTTRDLISEKNCPAIIYVSRTAKATMLAKRLMDDGMNAAAYHGKMDRAEKTANQNAFLAGEIDVMVATSAFGMGVDKKDVGLVIHYEISDSLENYVQEAGRAGRDENIEADCYVLFNEEDLSKHFIMLNQTKLSVKEIQQIWKAIKDITRFRSTVSNSALEIARKAGWDDTVAEIETRVKTAIAALEDAGYLKRGQNVPRIFANSILARTANEAIERIYASPRFTEREKEQATRIIKKLFSSKSRKHNNDETAESRVDYISDHLGIVREDVINVINLLREENILADNQDLTAFIKQGEQKNKSLAILESFVRIEKRLLPAMDSNPKAFQLKELNEWLERGGCGDVTPNKIRIVVNFWAIKNWIKRRISPSSKNHFEARTVLSPEVLSDKLKKRHELATFIVNLLYGRVPAPSSGTPEKEEVLVEFSVQELREAYKASSLFRQDIDTSDVEDTLFYLSRIEAIKIEGGFMVVYNKLTVERLELNNKINYKTDDYKKLEQFYANKVQQIHIVGEYAKKMLDDYRAALQFTEDYFRLNYTSFLNRYFKGDRQKEIKMNVTPAKFRQLFGELSPTQLKIINDKESAYIVVAAGPGSGKTRVLVHKLASLLLMEDVKHEQLLMLTFSRAAATEFKKRLLKLIGNAASFVEIKTFHSYCFDLLGKVGSLEKSDVILQRTIEKIRNGEVEPNRITKIVLVADEAQDMDKDEFDLIRALISRNEEMRVIAVGDDDQNIYQFRGADSKYLKKIAAVEGGQTYELTENYRSKSNLVDLANQFVAGISYRLKTTPIIAKQADNGQLKLVRYEYPNLITPLVKDVLNTSLAGSTCVLTKTNDEALHIAGLLLKNGVPAKLIQTNDGFNLHNLVEIRFFLDRFRTGEKTHVITDEAWEAAKLAAKAKFGSSANWTICSNMIRDFAATNVKKKYLSDLEVFVRESQPEDFYSESSETVFVSTIHKAKGKEFDNVFLLLEYSGPMDDDLRRQLYVAITRAKQNLTVHTNNACFDYLHTNNMERVHQQNPNEPPSQLAMQLSLKDIWLDHFIRTQPYTAELMAGDKLLISDDECIDINRRPILKFSRSAMDKIRAMEAKGYKPVKAVAEFVLYWQKEGASNEIMVALPKLYFDKQR